MSVQSGPPEASTSSFQLDWGVTMDAAPVAQPGTTHPRTTSHSRATIYCALLGLDPRNPDAVRKALTPPEIFPVPARKKAEKKKDHVGRPPNAFILYRIQLMASLHEDGRPDIAGHLQSMLSKGAGALWRSESDDVRSVFMAQAAAAAVLHKQMYPDYKYKPRTKEKVELEKAAKAPYRRRAKPPAKPPAAKRSGTARERKRRATSPRSTTILPSPSLPIALTSQLPLPLSQPSELPSTTRRPSLRSSWSAPVINSEGFSSDDWGNGGAWGESFMAVSIGGISGEEVDGAGQARMRGAVDGFESGSQGSSFPSAANMGNQWWRPIPEEFEVESVPSTSRLPFALAPPGSDGTFGQVDLPSAAQSNGATHAPGYSHEYPTRYRRQSKSNTPLQESFPIPAFDRAAFGSSPNMKEALDNFLRTDAGGSHTVVDPAEQHHLSGIGEQGYHEQTITMLDAMAQPSPEGESPEDGDSQAYENEQSEGHCSEDELYDYPSPTGADHTGPLSDPSWTVPNSPIPFEEISRAEDSAALDALSTWEQQVLDAEIPERSPISSSSRTSSAYHLAQDFSYDATPMVSASHLGEFHFGYDGDVGSLEMDVDVGHPSHGSDENSSFDTPSEYYGW